MASTNYAGVSWPLRLLYHLFRLLAWMSTRVFFRRLSFQGLSNLRQNGPAIFIVNHPNTLTDVLLPGAYTPRVLFFLANYGLFKHPLSGWLLRRLYCIPVKRVEDVGEGVERDNNAAFEQSFQHLEKGGALFVAPEGVSWMDRFVRPFKTGTARIALGAEARQAWQLGVKIVPIGLSYSAPRLFRSEAVVRVGVPVVVAEWAENWRQNAAQAFESLTQHLENQLQKLTIDATNPEGDRRLQLIETVLRHSRPLSQIAAFERSQQLSQTHLQRPDVQHAADHYEALLLQHRLSDLGVFSATLPGAGRWVGWASVLLVLGFPVLLAGSAFWLLPCFLPWLLARRLNIYPGYDSTIKMLAGLFVTFPLAIWGGWQLCQPWFPSGWWFFPWLVGVGLLGLLLEHYLDVAERVGAHWGAVRIGNAPLALLKNARQAVLGLVSA